MAVRRHRDTMILVYGRALVACSLVVAAACGPAVRAPKTRLTTKELVERFKPSVVRIESSMHGRIANGSGFVVGADGRIATNLHVIAGADSIKVTLLDGTHYVVERVVAIDLARDLAVLRIGRRDLPIVTLGDSDKVSAGDPVVVIGNPLGVFDFSVSDGLISSVRPLSADLVALQISAPISQGSSGGPLFNPYGEVIGVATFISREGQNINFGVPANYLRPLLDRQGGETVAKFSARMAELVANAEGQEKAAAGPGDGSKIIRRVPRYEIAILDGCDDVQVLAVFRSISEAIQLGAPVYNQGEHEACFVIYRKVADKYESDAKMCKGIREAFGQGLLRAEATDGFTGKAWAIRDTFDGVTDVIVRKANASAAPR
jgi:serine protease Do